MNADGVTSDSDVNKFVSAWPTNVLWISRQQLVLSATEASDQCNSSKEVGHERRSSTVRAATCRTLVNQREQRCSILNGTSLMMTSQPRRVDDGLGADDVGGSSMSDFRILAKDGQEDKNTIAKMQTRN